MDHFQLQHSSKRPRPAPQNRRLEFVWGERDPCCRWPVVPFRREVPPADEDGYRRPGGILRGMVERPRRYICVVKDDAPRSDAARNVIRLILFCAEVTRLTPAGILLPLVYTTTSA